MRYIILICLFFVIQESFCQKKWSIGVVAGPNMTSPIPFRVSSNKYTFKLGADVGLVVYKELNKYFSFNTGFIIGMKHYLHSYKTSYYQGNVIMGTIINRANVYYNDINIPFNFNFNLALNQKLSLLASTGVSVGWITQRNTKYASNPYFYEPDVTNDYFSIKRIDNVYLTAGIGVRYNIKDNMSLIIQPTLMRDVDIIRYRYLIDYNLRATLLYSL